MSIKYQAYSEYKSSSVQWLKDIPKHWELTRIKYISELTPRKPIVQRELYCSFLPMEKLKTDSIVLNEMRVINDVYDGYTYFEDADILMAKVTPCFENKNIAVAKNLINSIGFGSSEIYVLRVNKETSNRFLFYRLQEDSFMEIATAAMTGAGGLKRVPSEVVNNYITALPEANEQEKIANFLDHETAKIDTLIEKQQQLIKLLKEKRQAVISHAVTKGLNPDAPMHDSGVEWLGEVPEHWGVRRINLLFSESSNRAKTEKELDYPVLSVSIHHGISDKELNEEELERKVQRSEDKSLYKVLHNNYMAYNMMRAWQGGFGASKLSGLVSPAYVVCQPKTTLDTHYFELALRTSNAVTELKRFSRGITDFRLRLYWEEFKNISVPVPPKDEIEAILRSISDINFTFSNLGDVAEQQILLLQERRTALISAAVTGKIDVRNWRAA